MSLERRLQSIATTLNNPVTIVVMEYEMLADLYSVTFPKISINRIPVIAMHVLEAKYRVKYNRVNKAYVREQYGI